MKIKVTGSPRKITIKKKPGTKLKLSGTRKMTRGSKKAPRRNPRLYA